MTGGARPPAPFEWRVPAAWQAIDLIADLHLCAAMPATFDAWAEHLRCTDADAVLMLGDLFEVWVGDDARELDFERRCVDVMREAGGRRVLGFMHGNRDFLVGGELLEAAALHPLPDPTVLLAWDRRVVLTHGDALCLADQEYQQFRALVRSAEWQSGFLARPLAERIEFARHIRSESRARQRFDGSAGADVDPDVTRAWMDSAQADLLVHGHTHRPGAHEVGPGRWRQVLSDWDLDDASSPRGEVLRLTPQGLLRLAPCAVR